MDVQKYLLTKGYDYRVMDRPSGPTAVMECPKCHDREKSFGISLDTGAFSCMRKNKCGWSGSFKDFQIYHGDTPTNVVGDSHFKKRPKEYEKPKGSPGDADDAVYGFFGERGISKETVDAYKIGKLRTAIAFRYYENGEVVNIKYRGIIEKKFAQEKNAPPALYGKWLVPGEAMELIITEGEIDCMSYYQYGIQSVVSIPSGVNDTRWIEYNWDFLKRFTKIYISYDMDDAGRSMVEKIAKRLGDYRVYDLHLPCKDANECLVNGVAFGVINDAMISAVGYDRDELRSAIEYADKVVDQIVRPEEHYGRKTGIPYLDNTLKGWRDSEVTVWTGRSASGKTTMLMQVLVTDILSELDYSRALPVCLGSFEMRPEVLLSWAVYQARYILNMRKGRVWSGGMISEQEIREILEKVLSNVYIINIKDSVDEGLVFDLIEYAARKYGCKVFVVDSLMRIKLTNSPDRLDAQLGFMDKISKFADIFDAHVHLVAHPRKGEHDTDRPDKVAVKGASEITDIADNVISLYRFSDEQRRDVAKKKEIDIIQVATTGLYLHKNRAEGACGETKMMFDFENKYFMGV